MSQFEKLSREKHIFTKRNLLILGVFVGLMIILLVGKNLYDTYHDRPLAQGLQYVGRDYSSGCAPLRLLCFGPETEYYYYATDADPSSIANLFPNWRVEEVLDAPTHLGNGGALNSHGYNLRDIQTHTHAYYGYIIDRSAAVSALRLLPTTKKYIIEVSREDYTLLRQSIGR